MKFICISFSIQDLSAIAQAVSAAVSLLLAIFIFIYQRRIDKAAKKEDSSTHDRDNRLDLIRQIIIVPNINILSTFYKSIIDIQKRYKTSPPNEIEKILINDSAKDGFYELRRSFIHLLHAADISLANEIETNISALLDNVTQSIFDDAVDLTDPKIFERKIYSPVRLSQTTVYGLIMSYKG